MPRILLFTVLFVLLLVGALSSHDDEFRSTPEERFLSTERGNQAIRMTNREIAMLPFLYREPQLNRWYARFFEGTDIVVPDQARIFVLEDPAHSDAILLMCVLTPKAQRADPNMVMHRNMARMLRDEFVERKKIPDGIKLFVAVDTWPDEGFEDYRLRFGMQYLEPYLLRNPEKQLPPITGFGRTRTSITGVQYVIRQMAPFMEVLEKRYAEILEMNGFRYHLDAKVSLVPHIRDLNAVMFLFEINPNVARSDRHLRMHTNIGMGFIDDLLDELPAIPDWFAAGVAVDSTGGYFAPVILH